MMPITDVFYRRALNEAEEVVLTYIEHHPILTAYDIAEKLGQTETVYMAIAHLTQNLYVEQSLATGAITKWGLPRSTGYVSL
jgi:hypothetical protein